MTTTKIDNVNTVRPALRPVEVERIDYRGGEYFLLRDGLEIAPQQLLVPLHFGGILALADGSRTIAALVEEAQNRFQTPVANGEVTDLFDALENAGMLEGETFDALREEAVTAWRALSARPMALANSGYPADAAALARKFDTLLAASRAAEIPAAQLDWQRGVGLLTPHIDYPRGGAIYADVWKSMGSAVREAEVAVILATDHRGDDPFTFQTLDYATPFGVLPTDRTLQGVLIDTIGAQDAFAGELRHRNEHSVELVINWLHHMRRGESLPIVPILVGSLNHFMRKGRKSSDAAPLAHFIETLRLEMQRRRVLLVASGDLAHVGPAFDGVPLDDADKSRISADDMLLLESMELGDAERFFSQIRRVRNHNNVCGVTPIYLTMRAAAGVGGVRHSYAVTPADRDFTSIVTIAGVSFT